MAENRGYHAHVYYNAETKPVAARLRETIIQQFTSSPAGSATSRAARTQSRSLT